jgi:hypothetical protein
MEEGFLDTVHINVFGETGQFDNSSHVPLQVWMGCVKLWERLLITCWT